jgi:hypothetical protein
MKGDDVVFAGFGLMGCAIWILSFLLGPFCLAYDLQHWIQFFTKQPTFISMWTWYILIGGILLGRFAIPVAIITWVLVMVGVVP